MNKDGLLTAWALHRLNILHLAENNPYWKLLPYQDELLKKMREQIAEKFTIPILDEAHIVDPPISNRSRDALKQLTFAYRYHTSWQSSIHRFQSERNASPQKLSWRLKPTLQSSMPNGTVCTDRSPVRSLVPLSYLCSLVPLEEKEPSIPPAPLLVDRQPPKKVSAILGRVSRAWP